MRPIPIIALAILLLSLKGAAAEANFHDALAGKHRLAAPFGFDVPDGKLALAIPSEPAESPHDVREGALEPLRPPAAASAGIEPQGRKNAPHSIDELCGALLTSAEENGLPVPFFANLIWQESRLQLNAVSSVGALGIAQFMPEVAAEVGLRDPFDPGQAIPASARFLRTLREQFDNLGLVAAAYNAGAHRVTEWLKHHRALPRETQTYVVRVTGHSAETWRKTPLADSQLAFAQPLPCRKLPAFAAIEQAQQAAAARQQLQQEESGIKLARIDPASDKDSGDPPLAADKSAPRGRHPAEQKRSPPRHHPVAERKEIHRSVRSGTPRREAHGARGARHEATHRARPHDKHKLA